MVVKKDGRREPYIREKIRSGLIKACEKRHVSLETIDQAVDRIEKAVRDTDEVSSKEIGERVMTELRNIDKIAYIRFASVYREFEDIERFEEELDKLQKK